MTFEQTKGSRCCIAGPRPGISAIADNTAPTITNNAYESLADVEFFMLGHAAQQQLHAAEPKQHATLDSSVPTQQPIVLF